MQRGLEEDGEVGRGQLTSSLVGWVTSLDFVLRAMDKHERVINRTMTGLRSEKGHFVKR